MAPRLEIHSAAPTTFQREFSLCSLLRCLRVHGARFFFLLTPSLLRSFIFCVFLCWLLSGYVDPFQGARKRNALLHHEMTWAGGMARHVLEGEEPPSSLVSSPTVMGAAWGAPIVVPPGVRNINDIDERQLPRSSGERQ